MPRFFATIPDSGLEIKNRCTKEGGIGEKLASIRKFGLEIKNRCTESPTTTGLPRTPLGNEQKDDDKLNKKIYGEQRKDYCPTAPLDWSRLPASGRAIHLGKRDQKSDLLR